MSQILGYTLPEHLRAREEAKRHERSVQIVALVVTLVCFVAAGMLVPGINRIRKEQQLLIDPDSIKGLPPDIALLGKLGTFRALAINWASMRADRLQEEGKTYEAFDLHRMICKLQPRFSKVWETAAWNMAYNISVSQYTPEARWQWVNGGIKLLRDDGLRYNPRSVTIHKQLAWIYWHKMGDILDDEHRNYRRALAMDIERVLGERPPATTLQEHQAWFKRFVDAPRPEDLGAYLSADADLARLVGELEEVGLEPDEIFLDFAARHLRSDAGTRNLARQRDDPEATEDEALIERRLAVLRDPDWAEPLDRLLTLLRSRALREGMKFDLDFLYGLMEEYGPLDLRSPFSHSLYWFSRGNEYAKGMKNTNEADSMNNARLVFFSLQSLVTRGKIIFTPNFDDPFGSYVEESTDVRFIPYLEETYYKLAKEQWGDDPNWDDEMGIFGTSYKVGFVSLMHNWMQMLYFEGGEKNLQQAERYYLTLREMNREPNGAIQEMYTKSLEDFMEKDLIEQMMTYKQGPAIIRSVLKKSLKELSLGEIDGSNRSRSLARKAFVYWDQSTNYDNNDRRKLQPFPILYRDEIFNYMTDPSINPMAKARLWSQLKFEDQQRVYDYLDEYFTALCNAVEPPWDEGRAFPEPPGMEQFRRQEQKLRGAARVEGVDQGTRRKKN